MIALPERLSLYSLAREILISLLYFPSTSTGPVRLLQVIDERPIDPLDFHLSPSLLNEQCPEVVPYY
jgi:hypothetical protein